MKIMIGCQIRSDHQQTIIHLQSLEILDRESNGKLISLNALSSNLQEAF